MADARPFSSLEAKWQAWWEEQGTYRAREASRGLLKRVFGGGSQEEKFYGLVEFPYPSGEGLHVGHPRSYTAIDAVTRKRRMEGKNVLYPIGWDAFGLPTENFAIKNKMKPQDATAKNVANFTRQLKSIGFGFDWSREVNTTDAAYYKWTQWMFLQFFKSAFDEKSGKAVIAKQSDAPVAPGTRERMAYKAKTTINWCPNCKIGLANEEAVGGLCERCGNPVEKREKAQWMIAITKYAERLLQDLDTVDYLDKIKAQQVNWIGKSEGAFVDFEIKGQSARPNRVLLATTNAGKIKRVKMLGAKALPGIEFVTPEEAGIEPIDVQEDGTLEENARKKAKAYADKTDLPVLGMDSGFFIDGEDLDPVRVKRNALGDVEEASLSTEEIGKRMNAFYRDLAHRRGGEVSAYWQDKYVVVYPDGTEHRTGAIREVILTDQVHGKLDFHLPVRCLYRVKATRKYVADQTPEDELKEMAPVTVMLEELFGEERVRVFTTRPDTLFGATYLVLAPEHEQITRWMHAGKITNEREVNNYRAAAAKKNDIERGGDGKEKTGVCLEGVTAINPATNEPIPVWIADYVLAGYGTGAIMAVPAHDERDFAFAKTFKLEVRCVISPNRLISANTEEELEEMRANILSGKVCFPLRGDLINSGEFTGKTSFDGADAIIAWLEEKGLGARTTNYKLRDWVFSRQRYWGEPIPVIICEKCGYVPVPENQLPVLLPDVASYEPTDTGESPLSKIRAWVEVKCPSCGGSAERETDTMPNWAGSSWYFLRYCDPKNEKEFASPEALKYWMPVDLYNGGMEHTTLHLLYSRFWHKFLWDIGAVPKEIGPEPYRVRRSHGLILAEGGEKMSKSKGNVVNPDDIVSQYGADVFRVYELFMGPFDQPVPWDTNGIEGVRRFLEKVWRLFKEDAGSEKKGDLETIYHQTIKKVGDDIESLGFNTAVSQLMILTNAYVEAGAVPQAHREGYLQLLAPFAPHLTEELWSQMGKTESIHLSGWPSYDAAKTIAATFELVIQVNGKVRDKIIVPSDISEADAKVRALASESVKRYLDGKEPSKVLYIKGRLVTIVS